MSKEENIRLLPIECDYLTKVGKSTYPELPQQTKHFNLMRLAKSAALINDIKSKATNYLKNKKPNEKAYRSFAKANYNDNNVSNSLNTSVNSTQTPGFLKRSSFNSSTITGKISYAKKDTGIKVN